MVYLDSSALVKLVVTEPESTALREYLRDHPERVSSALARVEVWRALRRTGAPKAALQRADQVLARVALVAMDDPLLRAAAGVAQPGLRSLDALHLATALSLDDLDAVVTYDRRLDAAAAHAGLAVASPA